MSNLSELEREVLNLPPQQRERLVLAVWESLELSSAASADSVIDPEALEIAITRDKEIESGAVQAISYSEFMRRTGGE